MFYEWHASARAFVEGYSTSQSARQWDAESSLHAYGTNVEGEWDAVMESIKRCHEAVHAMGAPRITTTIKLGTRIDRDQSMAEKVRSVEKLLEES